MNVNIKTDYMDNEQYREYAKNEITKAREMIENGIYEDLAFIAIDIEHKEKDKYAYIVIGKRESPNSSKGYCQVCRINSDMLASAVKWTYKL